MYIAFSGPFLLLAFLDLVVYGQEKPNFQVWNLPDKSEDGQWGSNQCGQWKPYNDQSKCQNAFINHVIDFCLYCPHDTDTVGNAEREMVSVCVKRGYGTRTFSEGTFHGAHFIKTPHFLQVTGIGDFTGCRIPLGDDGGEMDPHGYDAKGNPIGALVFTRNRPGHEGEWIQIKEWSNFMSYGEFSFRGCYGPKAALYCPHTLDELGSRFNHPGNYDGGYFSQCESSSGEYPAIFNGTEVHQGGPIPIPEPHTAPPTYNCRFYDYIALDQMAKVIPYRRALAVDYPIEKEGLI